MLRTCTPSVIHAHALLPHRPDADNIRRQIVDMVRITEHQTVIYDLHQRHGVKMQPLTEIHNNRLENIDKSHGWQSDIRKIPPRGRQPQNQHDQDKLRSPRSPRQSGKENREFNSSTAPPLPPRNSSSFTSAAKPSKDMPKIKDGFQSPQPHSPTPNQNHQDNFKRIRSGVANQRQGPKPKSGRQRTDDSNSHYQSTNSSSPSDDKGESKASGQLGGVRGSAITNKRSNSRATSPIKREEVKKRANRFSASLDFFRRRLKMNQSKFLNPQNKTSQDDYIIRKDDGRNSPCKQRIDLRFVPRPPNTAKPANGKSSSGNDSHDTKESRFSYRLPEMENNDDNQRMTLGEIRTLPQVQTYVLEDDEEVCVGVSKEPAPLTSHNIEIHHMLMEAQSKKHRVEQNGVLYDARVLRWVEDSNTQKVQKMVTFEMPLPTMERVDTSIPTNGITFSKTRHHKWNELI